MAKKNHKKKSKIKALGSKKPKLLKVTQEQMEAFLSDIEKAALGSKNIEIAKFLIETNAWFTSELEQGRLTIARLRKLFQIQGKCTPFTTRS